MSYTALYRKYRPDTFDEAKGQDHIVTVLKNQIASNRVGHAYLFCGTRGTGKTSIAKIFAKAVNCEAPVDGNPCNECKICRAIKAQQSMNVIEIDAASNNGVDNIREIVEEVRYSPTEGHYKVYIIDEVHMLSAGAFNALLKTLEEPPEYVVFILATTEAHKIPITIMSRCQRYDFKRIPAELIAEHLKQLADAEQVEVEEKALRYIAGKADGAFRDAISLLDQCVSFCFGETMTYDRVLEVLGAVDIEIFAKLLRYICKGSVSECVQILDSVILSGRDLTQFITDFTWYMRNILLVKTAEGTVEVLEVSSEQSAILEHEATVYSAQMLMRYIRIFSELSNQIRYASQKRVQTELALIKLCCPQMESAQDALEDRIRILEEKIARGVFTTQEPTAQEETLEEESEPITEAALSDDLKAVAQQWSQILPKMPPLVRTILISARPTVGPEDSLLLLLENEMDRKIVEKTENLETITKVIERTIGKTLTVRIGALSQEPAAARKVTDITKLFAGLPVTVIK